MQDGIVGRGAEEFGSAIGIGNGHEAKQTIALAVQRFPLSYPSVVWLNLPGVPDGGVGRSAEEFDATIGIGNCHEVTQVIAPTV